MDVFPLPNGISDCIITGRSASDATGIATITSGAKQFSGLRVGATIVYQKFNNADPTYNKVKSIGVGNTSIVVSPITSVPGVFDGELPSNATTTHLRLGCLLEHQY